VFPFLCGRTVCPFGRAAIWVGVSLGCLLAAGVPNPPRLEFVSASLTSGPGREPPLGSVPKVPELIGTVRIRGLDARRSSYQLTLVPPAETGRGPRKIRVVPTTWAPSDPKDATLIRWTCAWPGAPSAEGWSVRIEHRRARPRVVVSGAIQHFFLPVRPPQPSAES
jgi:hypothetical protein